MVRFTSSFQIYLTAFLSFYAIKLVTLPFFDTSNTMVRSILLFEDQKKPNQNIQIWEHILMQI